MFIFYYFFFIKQFQMLCHFYLPVTPKNVERSWIVATGAARLVWLFYPQIVLYRQSNIADACDLFQIQCVNIHWLNSFDNFLSFFPNLRNCFLVIQGFSIRHFGFRRLCCRKILIFCVEAQLIKIQFSCPETEVDSRSVFVPMYVYLVYGIS